MRLVAKLSHENLKLFLCDFCGKNVGLPQSLDTHFKTVHSDIRSYMCGKCFGLKAKFEKT